MSTQTVNVCLKRFNMSSIPDHAIIVFLGKRKTGKTQLVIDYLYHHRDFPLGTVISETDEFNGTFKPHIPSIFIHPEYKSELIDNVLKRQKKICRHCKLDQKYKNVDPRAFLILEDCLADAKNWVNDKNIKWIFMNGRHAQLTFLLTMQYPLGIPPAYRTNIDYIFICKEPKVNNLKRLYEHYAGIFPTFQMFRDVLTQVTKDYGCMVLDNTSTSSLLSEQVFFYKADINQPNFNGFKMCYDVFWKNNEKYLQSGSDPEEMDEDNRSSNYENYAQPTKITFNVKHVG